MIKFILRTSDFADFLKNSFHGPLISRTFSQVPGVRKVRGIHLAISFLGFCRDQNFLIVLVMTSL